MTKETKELAIRGLEMLRGDDLYCARAAFRDLTPKQMQEKYGQSGRTRQEILDGYEEKSCQIDAAIQELRTSP